MTHSIDAIDHLAEILSAEAEGRPVDRRQARSLADYLARVCPEMRESMELISRRMAALAA